ncbi:MAG: hypothetical protein Q8S43_11130 [Actinomycetota bacterium]|nr:MAG: hypothetical protein FD171_2208 [Actinomycetota bacterium]MDP3631486.1 hypothetical protein [Actinomycetota bacterium]
MANDDEAIVGRPLTQFMSASTDPFERRMVAAYIEGGTDGLIQTAHPTAYRLTDATYRVIQNSATQVCEDS